MDRTCWICGKEFRTKKNVWECGSCALAKAKVQGQVPFSLVKET